MEGIDHRRPDAIKNQRKARNAAGGRSRVEKNTGLGWVGLLVNNHILPTNSFA